MKMMMMMIVVVWFMVHLKILRCSRSHIGVDVEVEVISHHHHSRLSRESAHWFTPNCFLQNTHTRTSTHIATIISCVCVYTGRKALAQCKKKRKESQHVRKQYNITFRLVPLYTTQH